MKIGFAFLSWMSTWDEAKMKFKFYIWNGKSKEKIHLSISKHTHNKLLKESFEQFLFHLFSIVCYFNSLPRFTHVRFLTCELRLSFFHPFFSESFSFRMSNKKEICCRNLSEMRKKTTHTRKRWGLKGKEKGVAKVWYDGWQENPHTYASEPFFYVKREVF